MSAERVNQLIEAGLWLRMSGDVEGARRLFEQALRLQPENARARELLGPGTGGGGADLPAEFRRETGGLPEPAQIVNFHRPERQASPPTPPASVPVPGPSPAPAVVAPPAPSAPKRAQLPTMPSVAPVVAPLVSTTPPPAHHAKPEPPARAPALPPSAPAESESEDGWDWDNQPALVVQPVHGMGRDALDVLSDSKPAPFLQPPVPAGGGDAVQDVKALIKGAKDLIGLDDHSGALELIQKALLVEPKSAEVLRLREQSERTLAAMYESKLGSLDARPRVVLREDEVIWLNLDHRAGFVLAQIDGTMSYEDLFLVSGMSRLDTLRILAELKEENVIG